jgi:hypothetical protein
VEVVVVEVVVVEVVVVDGTFSGLRRNKDKRVEEL